MEASVDVAVSAMLETLRKLDAPQLDYVLRSLRMLNEEVEAGQARAWEVADPLLVGGLAR